jgi:hypothetical protein
MQKLAWLFQTDSARERCVRDESAKWAREHFAGPQETLARAVAYTLVSTLHVGFAQLTPATDIVRDLGADEWTEWGRDSDVFGTRTRRGIRSGIPVRG